MKKFCINVLLIFVISIALFGCDGKSKVEHFFGKNNKKNYDFNVVLKDVKCVTDYPDDTRIKDIESIKFGRYDLDIQSHDYEMYGRSYEDEITIDRLFLISQQDCYKYFNANVENFNIKIRTSEYDYRGEDYGSGTDFWTRTPYEYDGKDIYHAYDAFNISFADVTAHGMVDAGYLPLPMCVGVRPAMWVRY